jgi:23S rRNA pseudouridine1911/1915/1917 synthase
VGSGAPLAVSPPAAPEVRRFPVPPALAGERLDRALAALVPDMSRSEARRAIDGDQVTLESGINPRPSARLAAGDAILLRWAPVPPLRVVPEPLPLDVRYEDEHVLVILKPAGLVVHPGAGAREGTLVGGLLWRYPALPGDPLRPGLVHRLDRDTSGLMVVARSAVAHRALAAQVARRTMLRRYEALVFGEPRESAGVIAAPIGRSRRDRTRMAVVRRGGREAMTDYRVVERLGIASRLELDLRTGRTHQIRVHLEHIGHPVIGDPKYGGRPRSLVALPAGERGRARRLLDTMGRQALHAFELAFDHPLTAERLTIRAERPPDLEVALAILREPPR